MERKLETCDALMISLVNMNNQQSPKLVMLAKLVLYTRDMYNDREDKKEKNKPGRKYEPGNTKTQMKRCEHKDQGCSHIIIHNKHGPV